MNYNKNASDGEYRAKTPLDFELRNLDTQFSKGKRCRRFLQLSFHTCFIAGVGLAIASSSLLVNILARRASQLLALTQRPSNTLDTRLSGGCGFRNCKFSASVSMGGLEIPSLKSRRPSRRTLEALACCRSNPRR